MPKDRKQERWIRTINAWILVALTLFAAIVCGVAGKPSAAICATTLAGALLIVDAIARVREVLQDILDELQQTRE